MRFDCAKVIGLPSRRVKRRYPPRAFAFARRPLRRRRRRTRPRAPRPPSSSYPPGRDRARPRARTETSPPPRRRRDGRNPTGIRLRPRLTGPAAHPRVGTPRGAGECPRSRVRAMRRAAAAAGAGRPGRRATPAPSTEAVVADALNDSSTASRLRLRLRARCRASPPIPVGTLGVTRGVVRGATARGWLPSGGRGEGWVRRLGRWFRRLGRWFRRLGRILETRARGVAESAPRALPSRVRRGFRRGFGPRLPSRRRRRRASVVPASVVPASVVAVAASRGDASIAVFSSAVGDVAADVLVHASGCGGPRRGLGTGAWTGGRCGRRRRVAVAVAVAVVVAMVRVLVVRCHTEGARARPGRGVLSALPREAVEPQQDVRGGHREACDARGRRRRPRRGGVAVPRHRARARRER